MSALASVFPPAPLRYRDLELTALSFAGEVRYHERTTGVLAFRLSERELMLLARVVGTAGRGALMMMLFLKIVAREDRLLDDSSIATEIGGATSRDVARLVGSLVLAGLVTRTHERGGYKVSFGRSAA